MATYINVPNHGSMRSHLWIGVGDTRQAFCGLMVCRWENDFKRQTWHVVKRANKNPPVTCRVCLDRLAGKSIIPSEGTPPEGTLPKEPSE